ncbi:hypothetical protein IEO21_08368 [Rhodonia placenta]|uniref:DUF431-domain-containing protein n=1 Tax=Rhodonia placenta TaxID=104341 RepID=A0A8H7NWA4_9APHY|nr:hypothetical protein IEO21_08368 [Postia placenta]
MEEDEESSKSIPRWVELEYMHMRKLAGSEGHVHFTHLSQSSCNALLTLVAGEKNDTGVADVSSHTMSVLELMKASGVPMDKVCLLDPKAEHELSPDDRDKFSWYLFGVSDDPPRDRTSELRVLGFPTRHLGPVQMTTDTALGVTKLVVQDKIPLTKVPYIDHPTITFNEKESVEMPFRMSGSLGEPTLPPGMRELLKEDLDRGFDI